jgi:hypothetical protein
MLTSVQPYRAYGEGQIALERALFCLECELIFAGTAHCPRCGDEAVWPLNQWLPSARPSAPTFPNHGAGLAGRGLRVVYLDEKFSNR